MSDSSMALKPVIDEPSKEMPWASASSRCSRPMENDLSWPRMSVNHIRMNRMSRSETSALTSSADSGLRSSATATTSRRLVDLAPTAGRIRVDRRACQPHLRPGLELQQRRAQRVAHVGQGVGHAHRRAGMDLALDDPAPLELLHALRAQAVGEVG